MIRLWHYSCLSFELSWIAIEFADWLLKFANGYVSLFNLNTNSFFEKFLKAMLRDFLFSWIGGWVGYFSYDTVRYVEKKKLPFEKAPHDDRQLADIHLGLYDNVIVFDHVEKVPFVYPLTIWKTFFDISAIHRFF